WHDKGGFQAFRSIVTRIGVNANCNYQFLHTLGGGIYLYVFGDRIGALELSGLSFDSVCAADGGFGGELGIEKVYKYFDTFKLSSRPAPVRISIGANTT